MAKKKTTMEVNVKGTGIKSTAKDVKKTRKETEKLDKSQDKLSGSTNRYHKLQKGVAQAGANSTKNFSKMNQTLGGGGSSGLVAAYATLAANVFAATAAFSALQRAAEFAQLEKGLHELGHQSGRTLSILADGLRDVTGGALSAEQAMRGAALGISGGFGGAELEGLAKIAKGAAITLGRNLPDAFDRLTRGAIKLEPEILDELGIMVRVDDAAENYAATIGKTASSLTMMEKRQAFMNAILEQGESKFGEIAEAVEPDVYTKLGATFADLTKDIFTFINETLMLEKVIGFLAENVTVLAGVMLLFGSTIASKMLPFLADGAKAAHAQAEKMAALAEATLNAGQAQKALAIGKLGQAGGAGLSKGYQDAAAAMAENGAELADLEKLQKSLNGSIGHYSSQAKMGAALNSTANKQRLVQLNLEKNHLAQVIAMEKGRHVDMVKFATLQASSTFAMTGANAIQAYTDGLQGLGASMSAINAGYKTYVASILQAKAATLAQGKTVGWMTKMNVWGAASVKWLALQFRLLGAAIMKAIVPIALIVIAIGAAIALWNKFYNTKEQKKYNEGMGQLDTLLGEVEEKVSKMNKAMSNTKNLADGQNRAFEIQSGILTELADKMRDLIKLRKEASKSLPGEDETDVQGSNRLRSMWASAGIFTPGEEEFDKNFRSAMDKGKFDSMGKGYRGILALKDSPEVKTTMGILTSEIPGAAKMMQDKLEKIMEDPFVSNEESAKALARAVKQVEAAYGNLGPASTALRQALGELEKESSKFLTTFGQKTSVDAFVQSFEAVDKAIADFTTTVKEDAGLENWAEVVGTALLDVGSKTAMLIGPDFVAAQKTVRDLTKEVNKYAIDQDKSLQQLRDEGGHKLVEDLDKALGILKGQEKAYNHISKEVKQIQRMERMRKRQNEALKNIQKDINKLAKIGLDMAGKQFRIEERRLKNEQALAKSKNDLIKQQFQSLTKVTKEGIGWGMKLKKQAVDYDSFIKMSYHEQNQIIKDSGISQDALNSLRAGNYDQEVRNLEILRAQRGAAHKADKEKAEALKKRLELEEKLLDIAQKMAEIELRLFNYRTQGTTDLDAGDEARLKVQAAIDDFNFAKEKMKQEKAIIKAKADLQKVDLNLINKQIQLVNRQTKQYLSEEKGMTLEEVNAFVKTDAGKGELVDELTPAFIKTSEDAIDALADKQKEALEEDAKLLGLQVELAIADGLINIKEALENGEIDLGKAIVDQIFIASKRGAGITPEVAPTEETPEQKEAREKKEKQMQRQDRMQIASGMMAKFKGELAEISEEGAGMSQFINGMDMMAQSIVNFANGANKIQAVQGIIAGVGEAIAGASRAQAAEVENQIKLEEKRDGKSKESLAKIQALKMKKYQIEKKAFEQDKKIKLAGAVIDGLSAIVSGFATKPFMPMGLAMGAMATAMTMMKIKAIKNTQFGQSPPDPSSGATASTALSIGKRNNSIDVSRGASGGELGYLRGQRGYGTASNFVPTGGAAGLRRGYQTGSNGILVGEQGPEMIQPRGPYEVVPNDRLGGGMPNVNFTINAMDAAGVEDVITRQQGHIINLIRSAANDNGEQFLEQVDTQVLK